MGPRRLGPPDAVKARAQIGEPSPRRRGRYHPAGPPRRRPVVLSMRAGMRARLSWMMALVYAVQGAFWPLLAVHLKDLGLAGRERGWVFATLAIGSCLMPLGAGHVVDRFFA